MARSIRAAGAYGPRNSLRYLNPRRKLAQVATRLLNTLTAHVNAMV